MLQILGKLKQLWLDQSVEHRLWARAVAFQPRPMVEIKQKRQFFMRFFAFQAILNTFYFWVKIFEKKIFYSGRHKICNTILVIFTPIDHNYENKNILFSKFIFLTKSVIYQCLQKVKWTSESKVIDVQTSNLFSGNWELACKLFQIYHATANFFSPPKVHAIPPVTTVPQLRQRTCSGQPDQQAAVNASLFTASCGSGKKMTMHQPLLQPIVRSGSSHRRRWRTTH